MRAFIGLGSNFGDRHSHVSKALLRLKRVLTNVEISEIVETQALDREGKIEPSSPEYLNAVVAGDSDMTPRALFLKLIAIETELGRLVGEKSRYLPRTIDLDLLVLEDAGRSIVIRDSDLIVPHPRLDQRPFLLKALVELGADYPTALINR